MSKTRLSKRQIKTFAGDVVSLRLISQEDISRADIRWTTTDPDIVSIRTFRGNDDDSFSDGVLLTMLSEGNCDITAELDGSTFSCPVTVRIMNTAYPSEKFEYFFGDFHAHTSLIHTKKEFLERDKHHPSDVLCQVKQEGFFDTYVISDHSALMNNREFFNVFLACEAVDDPDFIPFAGAESDISILEKDAYGRIHKNSVEIVTFNSADYAFCSSWDEFSHKTSQNPLAVASFAHPRILGYDKPGIWNFSLKEKTTLEMLDRFRMIEMGDGTDHEQTLIHELMYSVALDCGYKVAPISTSDRHCPPWGSTSARGKTIILAPEKSREMFLDAILNARLYATENGNVKLWYTVNGYMPSQTLPLTDTYDFKVRISHFTPPLESEKTSVLEVISDYGEVVYCQELTPSKNISIDFTVNSDRARYFFLRLHSTGGDRTWSSAIWTGREFDPCPIKVTAESKK